MDAAKNDRNSARLWRHNKKCLLPLIFVTGSVIRMSYYFIWIVSAILTLRNMTPLFLWIYLHHFTTYTWHDNTARKNIGCFLDSVVFSIHLYWLLKWTAASFSPKFPRLGLHSSQIYFQSITITSNFHCIQNTSSIMQRIIKPLSDSNHITYVSSHN